MSENYIPLYNIIYDISKFASDNNNYDDHLHQRTQKLYWGNLSASMSSIAITNETS